MIYLSVFYFYYWYMWESCLIHTTVGLSTGLIIQEGCYVYWPHVYRNTIYQTVLSQNDPVLGMFNCLCKICVCYIADDNPDIRVHPGIFTDIFWYLRFLQPQPLFHRWVNFVHCCFWLYCVSNSCFCIDNVCLSVCKHFNICLSIK